MRVMKYIRTKDGKIIDLQLWNNHNVIMFNSGNCYNKKNIVNHYDFYIKNDEVYAIPKRKDGIRLDKKYSDILVEYNVVAQADTIEELFDELVVHNPSNDGDFYPKHFVYKNKWETILQPMSDYQKSKGIEIYGAIWTDKGLIYVAKMNIKGELELL